MKISILIGTRNRMEVLRRCLESCAMQRYPDLEIVVLDDASSPPMDPAALQQIVGDRHPIRTVRSDTPLGLAKVRNRLMQEAAGDVFLIIDDDAYFDDAEALQRLADTFDASPEVGIVAMNIRDYRDDRIRALTPHTRRQLRRDASLLEKPHLISYFLGGAHAIRRPLIASCGGFDEVFMYGSDEIELAYRALDRGYQLMFQPDILVHHKPPAQVSGSRSERAWRLYYLTRNRILFAYKHLPLRFTLPYAAGWLGFYGLQALRNRIPGAFARGLRDGLRDLRNIERRPIRPTTVEYLKAHYGRLWY